MAKIVKIIKERIITYKVDTPPGASARISDEKAIDIVKKRIEAEAPLDIIDDQETIKKFSVSDE